MHLHFIPGEKCFCFMNPQSAGLSKNIDFSYNCGLGFADWSEQPLFKVPQNNYISISSVTNTEKAVNLCQGKTNLVKLWQNTSK